MFQQNASQMLNKFKSSYITKISYILCLKMIKHVNL